MSMRVKRSRDSNFTSSALAARRSLIASHGITVSGVLLWTSRKGRLRAYRVPF